VFATSEVKYVDVRNRSNVRFDARSFHFKRAIAQDEKYGKANGVFRHPCDRFRQFAAPTHDLVRPLGSTLFRNARRSLDRFSRGLPRVAANARACDIVFFGGRVKP
jgi:hypothetical protein